MSDQLPPDLEARIRAGCPACGGTEDVTSAYPSGTGPVPCPWCARVRALVVPLVAEHARRIHVCGCFTEADEAALHGTAISSLNVLCHCPSDYPDGPEAWCTCAWCQLVRSFVPGPGGDISETKPDALLLGAYIKQVNGQHPPLSRLSIGKAVARHMIRRVRELAKYYRLCQQYEAEDALKELADELEQELEELEET